MSGILSFLFLACSVMGFINIAKLYKDKAVKGVSLFPTYVFITTNLFEVIYFGRLHDWLPVMGSVAMLVGNVVWLGLAIRYSGKRSCHF
jgi:hypothetical protein